MSGQGTLRDGYNRQVQFGWMALDLIEYPVRPRSLTTYARNYCIEHRSFPGIQSCCALRGRGAHPSSCVGRQFCRNSLVRNLPSLLAANVVTVFTDIPQMSLDVSNAARWFNLFHGSPQRRICCAASIPVKLHWSAAASFAVTLETARSRLGY